MAITIILVDLLVAINLVVDHLNKMVLNNNFVINSSELHRQFQLLGSYEIGRKEVGIKARILVLNNDEKNMDSILSQLQSVQDVFYKRFNNQSHFKIYS